MAVGEREPDLNAVAAPAFDGDGRLVAIAGVQGPGSRFDGDAMHAAVGPLLAATGRISASLGWSGA
jgi:DNA-binding IclR family transcriptional regulator